MSTQAFTIYNASAGAGKTFTLVKEYIKILLDYEQDDAFRYILSITFTNKAVHEMKQRIVRSLSDFTEKITPERSQALLDNIVSETGISEHLVKQKSAKILKKMIHNYAAFDISTIDKFTHKVIRSFATDLELSVTFEVSLDTQLLLQESVEALVSRVGTDEALTQVLLEFSLQKAEEDKSWDVSHELLEIGALLTKENHAQELEMLKDYTLDNFNTLRNKLKGIIKNLEEKAKFMAQDILNHISNENIDLTSFTGQYFPKHIQKIIQGDAIDLTNAEYNKEEKIKAKAKTKDEASIKAFARLWAYKTDEVYKVLGEKGFYQAFLQNLMPLSLLKEIHQEMENIQKEQNLLSISEFNKIIHKELKEQPAPFIYERLGEKYRHFFIDEFQDTSQMQWENLVPLIDNALAGENESGKAGTLMIVGDPKQSIYRWRGGKAEQFISLSKEENPFSNPLKQTLNLDTNFRSYSEVIHFNNRFFSFISNQFTNGDYKDLYLNQSAQKTNNNVGGYVSFTMFNKIDKDEKIDKSTLYVEKTFEIIQDVVSQGYDYSDIVVLTRKRNEGVMVANYLTENQVPIISSETLLIENSEHVQLIISVLKLLKNPKDIESKANLLYSLAKNRKEAIDRHSLIKNGINRDNTYLSETDFETYLSNFEVEFKFQKARNLSLYEAVEYIIDQLVFEFKNDAYVQYFLDIVLDRSVKYQNSLVDFIDFWNLKSSDLSIPSPENSNAVQLMTIHKSKGLEFPVVIYPFAEEDLGRSRDKIWIPIESKEIDLPIALVNFKKEIQTYSSAIYSIYEQKKQEELLDLINVIYVAFTRASEQLYILSYKNSSSTGKEANNLSTLIKNFLEVEHTYIEEEENYSYGNKSKFSHKKRTIQPTKHIAGVNEKIGSNVVKIATKEGLMWDNETAQSIAKGNIIHELLKDVITSEDIEDVLQKGQFNGWFSANEIETYKDSLHKMITHPELEDFFDNKGRVVTEMPLLKKGAVTLKPDRIVLKEKDAYLLDYKTGENHEKYKKQLQDYQDALEEMGFQVRKKLLVFIQDDINIIHL